MNFNSDIIGKGISALFFRCDGFVDVYYVHHMQNLLFDLSK